MYFESAYEHLELRMLSLAEGDGDIYLPNPRPDGPVDHVLVCMEPSLGAWADSPEDARLKVEGGFRSFAHSMEDFLLHYAVRRFLCGCQRRW